MKGEGAAVLADIPALGDIRRRFQIIIEFYQPGEYLHNVFMRISVGRKRRVERGGVGADIALKCRRR